MKMERKDFAGPRNILQTKRRGFSIVFFVSSENWATWTHNWSLDWKLVILPYKLAIGSCASCPTYKTFPSRVHPYHQKAEVTST